jgi:hypothetical protein
VRTILYYVQGVVAPSAYQHRDLGEEP